MKISTSLFDEIQEHKNKAEKYCLRNLETLTDMLLGELEENSEEIAQFGFYTIEDCKDTIIQLCHCIDLIQKTNVHEN